jgi:hypothetical protein
MCSMMLRLRSARFAPATRLVTAGRTRRSVRFQPIGDMLNLPMVRTLRVPPPAYVFLRY